MNSNGSYRAPVAAPTANTPRNSSGNLPQAEAINSPGQPLSVPPVPPEAPEAIQVGAGEKLVVPREDLDADLDDGTELDLTSLQAIQIRKPARNEWIKLHLASEFPARLLPYKLRHDSIDIDYYVVDQSLQAQIRDELKQVRVFIYYSFNAAAFAIWIVRVSKGNSWYDSLAPLFKKPAEFFNDNKIRIRSDSKEKCYKFKNKTWKTEICWPTTLTNELLGEALGNDRFIRSADHPIYRELIDGTELKL
jgi:hypothetical protein